MSNCTVESCTFETDDGVKLSTRLFKPREEKDIKEGSPVVVMMHPYSIHGVCQGLLRGIAAGLADKGYKALSFDMRGVEMSTERASLTGFAEIKDVISVCKWVCEYQSANMILLVGSSADWTPSPLPFMAFASSLEAISSLNFSCSEQQSAARANQPPPWQCSAPATNNSSDGNRSSDWAAHFKLYNCGSPVSSTS
ncbi:hypothetical protein FF1_029614 [Malus domestica]